jgi:hypothetical protein
MSSFLIGETRLKGSELWLGADFQVWYRIGQLKPVFRGSRYSHSFVAEPPGRFYLTSYFPGEWSSPAGELATPKEVYKQAAGSFTALLIGWRKEAILGLRNLLECGDVAGLVAGETQRPAHPVSAPPGWQYLWFIGSDEVYGLEQGQEGEPVLCCHVHNDAVVLQKDLQARLTAGTRLQWSWKMDQLPSRVREDRLPTHDYLSIAVEFDNGQDITYYWSGELPEGTAYRCPIPTWTARETHVVVRSGDAGLGQWSREEREIFQDYQRFNGGAPPGGIVRIWLIGVSFFQHGLGHGSYREITLRSGREQIRIA